MWSDFETHLKEQMDNEHIAGTAVAVSQNGKIIYQKGFGFRDIKKEEPVTPETIFGTASITKSFTAIAILRLEQEGKLTMNDPVVRYLPGLELNDVEHIEEIKIHHLLSHTTGLPPIRRREELNRFVDHLKYLSSESYEMLGKPGEFFSYSNDAFLLLGAIIEQVTGQLYRRYITEHILAPLGMHRSTLSLEELSKFDNVTIPYEWDKKNEKWEEVSWPKLGTYEVGGGVRSNVLDLIKYAQVVLDGDNRIVNEQSLRKMRKPVHRIGRDQFYGYALKVTPDYSGYTLVEHSGGQPGVSSNFGFVPEKNLVVAVLTNVSGVPADDIWLAAVNTALDLPLGQMRSVEPEYKASFDEMQRFVGIYESGEGDKLEITMEGECPKAKVEDETFELRASDRQTLVDIEKEFPLPFFFNENDEPWAVFFGPRMLRRVK